MKTLPIVKTLWLLLALFFSGCAAKVETVYVPQKCLIEKPQVFLMRNCRVEKTDLSFMQCVAENYTKSQANYEALEVAFEGCK